jgi:GT2 family glycosyltransferase
MSNKKEKIGLGIVTHERIDYLKGLLDSLVPCKDVVDELVVVNDGKPIDGFELEFGTWLQNETNQGVAKSKNRAMKHLFDKNCEYFFIIEDDMVIKDKTIFEKSNDFGELLHTYMRSFDKNIFEFAFYYV